jgi:hypothetical protein
VTEGIYRTSNPEHPARQIICPHCRAAIGAACTETARPFGMKFVDYYHPERLAATENNNAQP